MRDIVDIGSHHTMEFVAFAPGENLRRLTPAYDDVPDIEKFGVITYHQNERNGDSCRVQVFFRSEGADKLPKTYGRVWVNAEALDPLTITELIVCDCGDSGRIVEGRWQPTAR